MHFRTQVPADEMTVDIGPATRDLFGSILAEAKTIIWNGPVGVYEREATRGGCIAVAEAIAHNISAFRIS